MSVFVFRCGKMIACWTVLIIFLCLLPNRGLPKESPQGPPDVNQLMQGKIYIFKLHPENAAGKGYRLVYMVAAPLRTYWNFKTDFENDFLLTNKLITYHRLIHYDDNVAITENIYATKPGVRFRWRTKISPNRHHLDFELMNPEECGQKFHYGRIELEEFGNYTRVTQTAYFDFFGATFWMNYPWYGGMHYYLDYTARWEQETVVRLIDKYR